MRALVLLVFAVSVISPSFAQEPRRQPNTVGPSALESHAARMEQDAMADLKAGQPATGFFVDLDIVFPTDRQEYEAVGKRILLVFALFSDDQSALPLARAYNGGVPLECLKSVPRDVPSESATAKALGRFRADTLCLLPIDVKRKSNRITIDFAKTHKGLEISSFNLEEPDFVSADVNPASPRMPDPVALSGFINREYPGFGFQVAP